MVTSRPRGSIVRSGTIQYCTHGEKKSADPNAPDAPGAALSCCADYSPPRGTATRARTRHRVDVDVTQHLHALSHKLYIKLNHTPSNCRRRRLTKPYARTTNTRCKSLYFLSTSPSYAPVHHLHTLIFSQLSFMHFQSISRAAIPNILQHGTQDPADGFAAVVTTKCLPRIATIALQLFHCDVLH
jgi:hypothetical protein